MIVLKNTPQVRTMKCLAWLVMALFVGACAMGWWMSSDAHVTDAESLWLLHKRLIVSVNIELALIAILASYLMIGMTVLLLRRSITEQRIAALCWTWIFPYFGVVWFLCFVASIDERDSYD